MEHTENSQQHSHHDLPSRLRRLYSTIESCLLEFGSLEPRQSAVMALAKEVKASKTEIRNLVKIARSAHPEINAIARAHKLVENAKASGQEPDVSMFRRLRPAAKSAGKDDLWLGEQLGYTPDFIQEQSGTDLDKEGRSRALPVFLGVLVVAAIVGGVIWQKTYGGLLAEQKALAALDISSWEESVELNTVDAYKGYLRNHSGGQFASQASEKIALLDAAAWEYAATDNSRLAYQGYLADFSMMADEALLKLDQVLPGDKFRDCVGCPEMIAVPAGEYEMGSAFGSSDETPVHSVTIKHVFAVGVFEISFAEWDNCVAHGPCAKNISDNTWGRGDRPLINVTWQDAQTYIEWLSGESAENYRLLTEAEWEYVSRAGSDGEYWWGNFFKIDIAVCEGCENDWQNGKTREVGSYESNPFGLYDTAGNVSEWVSDCWHDNYDGAPQNGDHWLSESAGDCALAPVRGGSWLSNTSFMRSAKRAKFERKSRDMHVGFRVARDI